MYVITGATGNTGNRVAAALLDAGKKVRAVGRSAEKLEALKEKGADVFVGDLSDKAAMSKAFAGADQAYIMIPPDPQSNDLRAYQNEIIESLAYAIEANDLSHIVTLSSVGAENADGYGPINGLYDMEKRFSSIEGVNILHLHPGYFMENTLYLAGMLKNMGMLGGPVNPDVKFAMIATRDIAEYATKRLLALDFEGKSIQELQGERDVSYAEVAKVYGEAVGKSGLGFMQVPPADAIGGMTQMGLSQHVASIYVEMSGKINSGELRFHEKRNAENSTSTSIEEFANVFKHVYESM